MFLPEVKSKIDEDISILLKKTNHPWNYICECGEASELTVKECQNTNAIFISHTHIDHFINFDTIIRHQLGLERKVTICGPEGIAQQIRSKILGYSWNLIEKGSLIYEIREIIREDLIHLYELEPPLWKLKKTGEITENTVFQTKEFRVEFCILDHKIPSIAYLFIEPDFLSINLENSGFNGGKWVAELKKAFTEKMPETSIEIQGKSHVAKALFHLLKYKKGHRLGVIMDHAPNESNHAKIKLLFDSTDVVFIECFFKDEDKDLAISHFHSYALASGKIMKESGVKNAIPVHFSRKYKEEEVEELIQEFEMAFKG